MCFNVKIIINFILKIRKNHILLPTGVVKTLKLSDWWKVSKTIIIYQELRNDCNPLRGGGK